VQCPFGYTTTTLIPTTIQDARENNYDSTLVLIAVTLYAEVLLGTEG